MGRKVIICPKCNGLGEKKIPGELYDYHKGLYHDPTFENCTTCAGHGRVIKIVTKIYTTMDGRDTSV